MKTEHMVEFIFPGSFFSESSYEEHNDRTVAPNVPARAFGYRFFDRDVYECTREDGKKFEEYGCQKNVSPWVYFGQVKTLAQVEQMARETPKRWDILLSNMRINEYKRIVQTKFGQSIPLNDDDTVLSVGSE